MPLRWRFRFRLHEAIHGGGRRSRLPVVQKAAGPASAKRFAAAAGAADFPLLKRLPVSAARRDSRRRPAQQASRCSKGCRLCLHEEIHGGWRSGLPVVQRGCWFCQREAIRAGGRRSRLPVVKKGCRFCLREEVPGGGRSRLPVVQKAAGSACAKRFTAAAGAASFPLLKKEEKDGIALCGDFGGV